MTSKPPSTTKWSLVRAGLRGVFWAILGLSLAEATGLLITLTPHLPSMGQQDWVPLRASSPLWTTPSVSRENLLSSTAAATRPSSTSLSFPLPLLGELCAPVLWASPEHAQLAVSTQNDWMAHRWKSQGVMESTQLPRDLDCEEITRSTLAHDARTQSSWVQRDLNAAHEDLMEALTSTGLAGLHVRLGDQRDARTVRSLAADLRAYNSELQASTGWEGPVLGLNGRVILNPYRSHAPGRMGDAWLDEAGFVHVTSGQASMAHEWFHALDFVMGTAQAYPVQGMGMAMQLDRWDVPSSHPLNTLWQSLRSPAARESFSRQASSEAASLMERFAATPADVSAQKFFVSMLDTDHPVSMALARQDPNWLEPPGSPWMSWQQAEAWGQLTGTDATNWPWFVIRHLDAIPEWVRLGAAWRPWSRTELLAHAFEAQFHDTRGPLDDTFLLRLPSLVPTPVERSAQAKAFRAFFQQAPGWMGPAGQRWVSRP